MEDLTEHDPPARAPTTCARCGQLAPAPAPVTWSTLVERGGRLRLCERCSRENLRSIEARLDPEHW